MNWKVNTMKSSNKCRSTRDGERCAKVPGHVGFCESAERPWNKAGHVLRGCVTTSHLTWWRKPMEFPAVQHIQAVRSR